MRYSYLASPNDSGGYNYSDYKGDMYSVQIPQQSTDSPQPDAASAESQQAQSAPPPANQPVAQPPAQKGAPFDPGNPNVVYCGDAGEQPCPQANQQ
jgi:hypothetical protein